MIILNIPIGFSGSGKTTYYLSNYDQDSSIYISKDSLRREICGNVNDQSQNKRIAILASKQLTKAIENCVAKESLEGDQDINIYYDNINLGILSTIKKYLNDYPTLMIKVLLFADSLNPRLRSKRVNQDIKSGADRANTGDIIRENAQNEIREYKRNKYSIIAYRRSLCGSEMAQRLSIFEIRGGQAYALN